MPLLEKLVEKGIVAKEKADSLLLDIKSSMKKEEEVILEAGLVPESVLFDLKSESLKIPLKEVEAEKVPLETLELIPEETAKYYQMMPLLKTDKILEIGMVYPEDFKAQEALKFLSRQGKISYKVLLITPTTFKNLLNQYRTLKREVGKALEELETEMKTETRVEGKGVAEFERLAEEAPITKIVAVVLRHAVEGGASDIHIEPTRQRLRVRFRLLGDLYSSIFLPMRIHPAVISRIKILSGLKIDETRVPQDGRFSTKVDNKSIDFRVSTFPTTLGEKAALRVLDPSTGLKTFEELGLGGSNLEILKETLSKPFGLILSTGPTGSGKTTTLYAALQTLNKEKVNIVTLENPVEYFIEGINQSQVRPDIDYDFSTGLRYVLRQDPDVIMVGEVRDEETASLVIHAALTGHIVLSTLHTSNALGVIPRLIDMGVKPYLIPPTLKLALSQRLVRRLCDKCKTKVIPSPDVKKIIQKELDSLPADIKKSLEVLKDITVYEPKGCKECNETGFSGRIGVFEVLKITDEISQIILKDPAGMKLEKAAKEQGMITMMQDGIIKVLGGVTSVEEVLRVAEEE